MEPSFGYQISSLELGRLAGLLAHKALILMAGPNGAGKGTVINLLLRDASLRIVSVRLCTTRPAGLYETRDGDYLYISPEKYEEMRKNREFLQWQNFPYGCYGTPIEALFRALQCGLCAVIDTGVGAILDLKKFFQEHAIPHLDFFVSPVPLDILTSPGGLDVAISVLQKRILRRNRGETEGDIQDRLDTARKWLYQVSQLPFHFIVNAEGKQDEAYRHIAAITHEYLSNLS